MSALVNRSHECWAQNCRHTRARQVLPCPQPKTKASQPTVCTNPSVILGSSLWKFPLLHPPHPPIPSLLVLKFSICSPNYCLWSRKDGNQPVFSGIRFRPSPYCLLSSIHRWWPFPCRENFHFRAFPTTLCCKGTLATWRLYLYHGHTFVPATILECMALFPHIQSDYYGERIQWTFKNMKQLWTSARRWLM